MSAPIKPWERAVAGSQSVGETQANGTTNSAVPACCLPGGVAGSGPPPALPPRPSQQRPLGSPYGGMPGYGSYGGYGGSYGSMYSPLSGSMYGGMYGSSMYGGYGLNHMAQNYETNGFVRMAEENSRQAFQSIESIVQAVGSVAMMLESTFHAVYNSFRAVIGVADHFSRMKTHFAQIFSALAVIRSLKWLYRRLLVLLRLREAGVSEEVWAAAADATLGKPNSAEGRRSSWPIMMFFAVVLGGPWLIWKFLRSLSEANDGGKWASGEEDHFVGQAQHDFTSAQQGELSFRQGQVIRIAPKELQPRVRGWLLASIDGQKSGLVPANYLKILGKRAGNRKNLSGPPPETLPLAASSKPSATGASGCCSGGTQPHGSALQGGPQAQQDDLHSAGVNAAFQNDLNTNFSDTNFSAENDPMNTNFPVAAENDPDFCINQVPITDQNATDILEDSSRDHQSGPN